jgi:DNA-binding NtrC family response regulator
MQDEPRLMRALEAALAEVSAEPGPDPVRSAWCGTLFLDGIAGLSHAAQRLLLCFAQRCLGGAASQGWPVRLAAGSADPLEAGTDGLGFLPELRDELDKIRVSLDPQPLAAGVA